MVSGLYFVLALIAGVCLGFYIGVKAMVSSCESAGHNHRKIK